MLQTSESFSKIFSVILDVQKDLASIKKTGWNAHTRSSYAKLQDILSFVRPRLNERGVLLMQYMSDDRSSVHVRFVHPESGEWAESSVPVHVDLNSRNVMHAIGSAMTYGCRYALAAALGLEVTDDDDGNAASGKGMDTKSRVSKAIHREPKQDEERSRTGISDKEFSELTKSIGSLEEARAVYREHSNILSQEQKDAIMKLSKML